MDKQNRKAIIAGNWKMNMTPTEAGHLIDALIPAVQGAGCEVVICVPYTDLCVAVAKCSGTNIHVGAENVHYEKSGAFTGEISADMLTDLGVEYVEVGQHIGADRPRRRVRRHRPQRAPPVLCRDRRDRQQARPRGAGRRPQAHHLRRREPGPARAGRHRGARPPAGQDRIAGRHGRGTQERRHRL